MPLSLFYLNCNILLMKKMTIKQFLFHSRKIRAEGRTPLRRAFECVYLIKLLLKHVQLT